jgi:4-hydroxy-tetrahydrodipicolinate synthase
MKTQRKHEGVVVPMVTPVNEAGHVDEPAVTRLVDHLLVGEVNGIFVLGTTGEGGAVLHNERREFVRHVVNCVQGRALVYAGVGDLHPHDAEAGREYLRVGADAIVARSPVSLPTDKLQGWFESILNGVAGPLILYNIPTLTRNFIPLEVVDQLCKDSRVVGIKDSQNDPERLEALLGQFGRQNGFSVFVGVGRLMYQGLEMGANGIVPSVGNLIPKVCSQLWACTRKGEWEAARRIAGRMNDVADVYQRGRGLTESLAALKVALQSHGLCEEHMLSPGKTLAEDESVAVREDLARVAAAADDMTALPAEPSRAGDIPTITST